LVDLKVMDVGGEIRKARDGARLSQEKLAEKAGITRVYVSQLENNLKSPTLEIFMRICTSLKVRASEMMARIERYR
jgi:transcriptional regulator with XRE-family HTH domain